MQRQRDKVPQHHLTHQNDLTSKVVLQKLINEKGEQRRCHLLTVRRSVRNQYRELQDTSFSLVPKRSTEEDDRHGNNATPVPPANV